MSPDDPRHGTAAGSQRHRKDKERPCDACRRAHADYTKAWRAKNPEWKVRKNAMDRALWQLAKLHHDDFDRLYAAEARKALGQPRLDAEVVR